MRREERERVRRLDHGRRARGVVVRAVADGVAAAGRASLACARCADVIHVGGEEDVLVLELRIAALEDPDHVGRRRSLEHPLAHREADAHTREGLERDGSAHRRAGRIEIEAGLRQERLCRHVSRDEGRGARRALARVTADDSRLTGREHRPDRIGPPADADDRGRVEPAHEPDDRRRRAVERYEHHLPRDRCRVERSVGRGRPRDQEGGTRGRSRRRAAAEQLQVGAEPPGRRDGAAQGHDGALGHELDPLDRVALEIGAPFAAGLETDPLELARDVGRDLLELGRRRGPAAHRVIGENPNVAPQVFGCDRPDGAPHRRPGLPRERAGGKEQAQRDRVTHGGAPVTRIERTES